MNIVYAGNGIEVTPPLRAHTEDKFKKLTRHFDHGLTEVKVIYRVEKKQHIAEATLHIAGRGHVHAEAQSDDLYHSISNLADKLDGLLKKQKEKMTSHHAKENSAPKESTDDQDLDEF